MSGWQILCHFKRKYQKNIIRKVIICFYFVFKLPCMCMKAETSGDPKVSKDTRWASLHFIMCLKWCISETNMNIYLSLNVIYLDWSLWTNLYKIYFTGWFQQPWNYIRRICIYVIDQNLPKCYRLVWIIRVFPHNNRGKNWEFLKQQHFFFFNLFIFLIIIIVFYYIFLHCCGFI